MSSMKLVGEYEFVDDGVVIEGEIKNTKIAELRSALRGVAHLEMYGGEANKKLGIMYKVPDIGVYNWWVGKGTLSVEDAGVALDLPANLSKRSPMHNLFHMAGILYSRGAGQTLFGSVRADLYDERTGYRVKSKYQLGFNSAWIYALTQPDGTFKVHLKGLANRHVLTMMLGRVTRFAKLLDGPIAKLAENSSNLAVPAGSGWY